MKDFLEIIFFILSLRKAKCYALASQPSTKVNKIPLKSLSRVKKCPTKDPKARRQKHYFVMSFTVEFHVGLPSQLVSFILSLKNLSDQTQQ